MAVFRTVKNRNYTVMSNYHLRDKNLSLRSKGLLSFMLSLPEDWKYSLKGLATVLKDGIYVIRNISRITIKPTYGKYGEMYEDYLKQHNPGLWNRLMLCGKLTEHLNELDRTARERIERMMPKLMKTAGITEELKRTDPFKWVGLMNNCKAQAEEIVLAEGHFDLVIPPTLKIKY